MLRRLEFPIFATALLLSIAACFRVVAADPVAIIEWQSATPESAGLDSAALNRLMDFVRAQQVPVHSVQIVRHGKLVFDAYFFPFRDGVRHDVASVTKSINSTLVGLALDQKLLANVSVPVLDLFADRLPATTDARKRRVTMENLLTMQSGWDCGVEMSDPRVNVDATLARMRRTPDWVRYALELPMVAEPGTRFAYCNANCHLLSAAISRASGGSTVAFARRTLFEPLGIRDLAWPADPQGINYGWSDLQLLPRDMAKIGLLYLQHGRWGDRQIISTSWIAEATRAHVDHTGNSDHYGYFWWVPGGDYPGVFEAVGRGGQRITVWPAKDLVVVFTGGGFETSILAPYIVEALKGPDPLPENPGAFTALRGKIAAAAAQPSAKPQPKVPKLANAISGRTFALAENALNLRSLKLRFGDSSEATLELLWEGHPERYPVGLDNVPRFATNSIVGLPVATRGGWHDEQTFDLQIDLVGGINCYDLRLRFTRTGDAVDVNIRERSGLDGGALHGTSDPKVP